jgi:hypothetical protein
MLRDVAPRRDPDLTRLAVISSHGNVGDLSKKNCMGRQFNFIPPFSDP